MVGASVGKIESEDPLGGFSQSDLVVDLESVKAGRNLAMWYQFEKELQKFLVGEETIEYGRS